MCVLSSMLCIYSFHQCSTSCLLTSPRRYLRITEPCIVHVVTAGAGGDDDIPRTQGCGQGRGGEQSGGVHGSRRWRSRAGHRPGGRPLQSTHCWRLRLLQHRLATPGSGDRQQGPRLREDSAVPCHRRRHCKLYTPLTSYLTQQLGYINNWLHRLR